MVSLRHRAPGPATHGFTVIELVITVAVLAILVAIATPSFRELSLNNRATSATNNLLADLALARNEAVKTARVAYVTATGGNWSNGWAVWVDANGNGSRDTASEPILREQPRIDPADMATENRFVLSAVAGAASGSTAITRIGFGTMGQSREPDNGARFAICRPDGEETKSRAIRVDLSGRAESVRDVTLVGMGCRG
jgi:type IV fimbrial biogenesis protein FimT